MMFASLCSFQLIVFLLIYKLNGANTTGKFYTTDENKKYYINDEQKYTWFDGLSECLKLNMTLVSVETSLKSQEVNTLVKNTFDRIVILWVGGIMTRYPDSRHYIWIATGQPFNYTYWHGKNPDFKGNNEYCIQIGWGPNMEWNDNRCTSNYGFMCEDHRQNSVIDSVKEHEKLKQNLIMEIKEQHNLQQDLQK
ncbi:lectin subunit alpha-like [Calliphora vicina]|uniref:lectin subunit alpha-like n=1 Tax=Calliphora vicina TaxID=7373 RepID=UPI00325AFE3B